MLGEGSVTALAPAVLRQLRQLRYLTLECALATTGGGCVRDARTTRVRVLSPLMTDAAEYPPPPLIFLVPPSPAVARVVCSDPCALL